MEHRCRRAFVCWLALLLALPLAVPSAIAADKDPEHDPGQIGNRDVAKGVNFYSVEREIGLGQTDGRRSGTPSQDGGRCNRLGICEPPGAERRAQLRREDPLHYKGRGFRRGQRIRAAWRFHVRQYRTDSEGRQRSRIGGCAGA